MPLCPSWKKVEFPDDKKEKAEDKAKKHELLFKSSFQRFYRLGYFLSIIIIEALPFVLIGSIISGFIEFMSRQTRFITSAQEQMGSDFFRLDHFLPAVRNRSYYKPLLEKSASYTAVPFLVTAPVINPIVLFATYSAFGNSFRMALLRAPGSMVVAILLGIFRASLQIAIFKENQQGCFMSMFSHLSAKDERFFGLCAGY